MGTQNKIIMPEDFNIERLGEVAQLLNMYVVYLGNYQYELVPQGQKSEILDARKAEQRIIKERLAVKATEKAKPLSVSNVYPFPIKPKQAKSNKWLNLLKGQQTPHFDGPGAA